MPAFHRRHHPFAVLTLLAVLALSNQALAQGKPNNLSEMHAGFRGIAWGQSIEDIGKKGITFGTFEAIGKSINVPVEGGTPMNVNNIPVKMGFTFIDGKFGGVVITPADPKKAQDLTAFFIQQFGLPVYMDHKAQQHVWQDAKITIIMRESNKVITFIIMNNDIFRKAKLPVEDYMAKAAAQAPKAKPGGI